MARSRNKQRRQQRLRQVDDTFGEGVDAPGGPGPDGTTPEWDADTAAEDELGAAFESLFDDGPADTDADEEDVFQTLEDLLGGEDSTPGADQERSEADGAFIARALEPERPRKTAAVAPLMLTQASSSVGAEAANKNPAAGASVADGAGASGKPSTGRALAKIPKTGPSGDASAADDTFWDDDFLSDGPSGSMEDDWQDDWSADSDGDWPDDSTTPPRTPPAGPVDLALKSDLEMLLAPSAEAPAPKPSAAMATARSTAAVPTGKATGKIPDHLAPVVAAPASLPDKAPQNRSVQTAPRNQDLDRAIERAGITPRRKTRVWAWIVWLAILLGLTYVAFLPYQYEVGGEFTIQSNQQTQVRARTTGEIIELNVSEGDWVEKDQVLAVLSNWDEERDVAVRRADLNALKANLETLKSGAKPEEIALAEEQVRIAEVQVSIAQEDLDRREKLFESGTISATARDDSANALSVAQAGLEAARASLALVRTGARESEIDALEAAIERGQEELEFSELTYDQTFVRAVSDGQIVSSLAEVPVGAFLAEGALFAVLEENRFVKAQIEVPESEITEVEIGAVAELRLWSSADVSLEGVVERIAPVAEEREFGQVVRVIVSLPNPDGLLTSNITGYGKIYAREAPVWEVFTRMIFRFFRIELWSWIP
ncbi:MAG: HlyD family efflux transporter periplasmic adaptor subunit [Pseudomonadota bacterium]